MNGALGNLALIWAAVFVAVVAARKTRLTPVLFFLFLGSLMVNTGLLPEHPDPFIHGFAEVGIIVIMFALGFEENISNFMLSLRKSWGIAFFGALAPFLVTYLLVDYYWDDTNIALMSALAMTATAVSLTMVSLKSMGLQASPVASRIMTSAVLDDIASLALVAVMVPIATGQSAVNLPDIALIMGKAVLFFLLVSVIGAWIFPHEPTGRIGRLSLMRWFGARDLLSFGKGEYATLVVLLMALVLGLLAHEFGFHPAVGAYMAGLILKEEYFHRIKNVDSYMDTRRVIDSAAFIWIGPVFFIQLGSQIVFDWHIFLSVIPQTGLLLLVLFFAQVSSAALAARYTGGMGWESSLMVGFGMLGRAELAFVVIDIAYVQNQILDTEAFYTLMFTAFWLNILVPVTIGLWRPYYERSLAKAALATEKLQTKRP